MSKTDDIIREVKRRPGLTATEYANRLEYAPSTVSSVLCRYIKSGRLTRVKSGLNEGGWLYYLK